MNAVTKTKLANILTAITAILAVSQTFLTNPPFENETIFAAGAVITYLTLATTTWKQYLSPDVSQTGVKVTLLIAVIATIGGLADLLKVFHLAEKSEQYVRWVITVIVAVLNIISKTVFPSISQKEKLENLQRLSSKND